MQDWAKMGQGRNKLETTFQMTKKLRSLICRKIRIKRKGVSVPLSFFTPPPPPPPPLSLETCNLLTSRITGKYQILWWYSWIKETENNCSIGKFSSILEIFKFLYSQPFHVLPNLRRHDEYYCMRQDAFLNISFELQLINQPNLVNWYVNRGNIFKIFWAIWRTGAKFQTHFNLATSFNYSRTNYAKFPVFNFFERANKGEFKMVNINYQKLIGFVIFSFH